MPNPMIRRVNWSVTTITQCFRRRSDSPPNRSVLHKRSFALTAKGEPRRTAGSRFWPVIFSKNPALLMQLVGRRVGDVRVLRLIRAWLKAGVLEEGKVTHPDWDSPQGGGFAVAFQHHAS
jgi:hypothetical protein